MLALFSTASMPQITRAAAVSSARVQFDNASFQTVSIDLDKAHLQLIWRNKDTHKPFGDLAQLKSWVKQQHKQLLFATNSGIYDRDQHPLGLHIENGKTITPLNTAHGNPAHGNFSLLPNGVFAIDKHQHAIIKTTQDWQKHPEDTSYATQSGPMLVIDGQINPKFKQDSDSLKWRNGVCVNDADHVTFAITAKPVNFYTFATLFRDKLKCKNALYLDGTLSQIYVHGTYFGPPTFMLKPWVGIWAVIGDP